MTDAATPDRIKGQNQEPLPSSSETFSLLGVEDSTGSHGAWWSAKKARAMTTTPSTDAVPEQSRAFWSLWLVVLCLSFPTFLFASGAYRPPLAFLSGIASSAKGSSASLRQQRPPPHDVRTPAPVTSPPKSAIHRLHAFDDSSPSPSPTTVQKPPVGVAGAPSPAARTVSSPAAAHQQKEPSAASPPLPLLDAVVHDDKTLGGLLFPSFDDASCLSRYRTHFYRKASPHKPSPYLSQRLREYEALHKRCGPYTRSYRRAFRLLKPGKEDDPGGSCKYVVWDPENGLGNRMLSIASAFLYSILSRRVLLLAGTSDLGRLFCQPFPGSSWLLPEDSPLRHRPYGQKYSESYGNLLKTSRIRNSSAGTLHRAFVYAHLSNDYDDYDKRFYCEDDQLLLDKIPWMTLRSDQYFIPALFLNPAFEKELVRLFPEKEAIFHHLGRYLFHPSNEVWSLITRYYDGNLKNARDILGIQIRVFEVKIRPFDLILQQILNCTQSEGLLPEVDVRRHAAPAKGARASKAVLLTSLHSFFYDRMKAMYSEHPAAGGERISFHQPSHEEQQHTGIVEHDGKALADIFLLSMADALVTSSWSTFGYVAQALAAVTPWVLQGPVHHWVPKPSCKRESSPEPCFHFPPNYDCRTKTYAETTKLLPYTSQCKDFWKGVKLHDQREAPRT